MLSRTLLLIATSAAAIALGACAEVQHGARSAGQPVGEVLAVPDHFNRGVNEGYQDDPGPNPYNR